MGWRDTIDAGNQAVRAAFGEAVTYRPLSGGSIVLEAPFSEEWVELDETSGASVVATRPNILLRVADLGGAQVQEGDEFDCRGESFVVRDPPRVDGTGTVVVFGIRTAP